MADESEVIRRVVAGEVDRFRWLVERYERPVFCLIRNLVPDAHTCEDVAQDVFLTAFHQLPGFDPARGRFSTWLMTIARNKCLNAMKKKRPAPGGGLSEQTTSRTPCDEAAERELFERLDEALQTLPIGQRAVFVLAELAGLPYEEIAEIEGVEVGTVRSRVSRAKERLRSLLRQFARDHQ
ncbi:MAG TPA: sigma-70 family RNA polymerase sigma factor [Thermoguttaceae bacterium]|nr:sigma-70 family RNA polymerase sigma factor [Thermoguttaceae bacterium]